MNSHQDKRLLILGAAGKAGNRLCLQAVEAGYQVDVIVRNPQKLAPGLSGKMTVITGDLTNGRLLAETMARGYDAVLSTVGIYHKTLETPVADITANIIAAMDESSVARFVCMSSIGTEATKGQGSIVVRLIARFFLKHVLLDKSAQERLIRDSKLDWTIIRPPQLIDQDSRQEYCRWEGNKPPAGVSWKISNADAAAEMLRALDTPDTIKKAFQISYRK